jgi:hypothetical protein
MNKLYVNPNYPEKDLFPYIDNAQKKIPPIKDNLKKIIDELAGLKIEGDVDIDKLKKGFDEYKKLYDEFIKSKDGIQLNEDSPFVYLNKEIEFDEDQFKKELLSGLMDISTIDDYENKINIMEREIDSYLGQIDVYKEEIKKYNSTINELIFVKVDGSQVRYKNEKDITEYDYTDNIEKVELNKFIFDETKFNLFIKFLNNLVDKLKQIQNQDELAKYDKSLQEFTETLPKINLPQITLVPNKTDLDKSVSFESQLQMLDAKIERIQNNVLKNDLKIKKRYIESKQSTLQIPQQGGKFETQFSMTKLTPKLIQILKKVDMINIELKQISNENKMALNIKSRILMYKTYLILVLQNEFNKKQSINYRYINRGLLQYYLSIILSISEKFDVNADGINDGIKFFNQYHFILIEKFKNFFKSILDLPAFTNDQIIDIENSQPNINMMFTLFNSFKDLLDSYNEQFQNKITIYARINDKTLHSKPLFETNPDDSRILSVNKKNCLQIGQYSTDQVPFTEVFDSKKFTETLTISKYMTLASQISKGKGIVFMTYGYSGTGKTFTLFGTNQKAGILQSTLLNINNMNKVLFRVYEIYGEGLSTTEYWNGFDAYDIYKYNLNVEQKLEVKNTGIVTEKYVTIINNEKVPNESKSAYLNSGQEDFIILAHDQKDMQAVFKNFSQFIDDLDELRKKEKRIVATKNNPASSRSIIVYEFFNVINEDTIVPFILIDLPGREEIKQTYYDEFIVNNPQIIDIDKVRVKASMLNPLYISLLDRDIVNQIIKKGEEIPKTSKDKINIIFEKINSYIQKKDLSGLKEFIVKYLDTKQIAISSEYFDLIYSGYFINENIVGLIKIILVNLLGKTDVKDKLIFSQSKKLSSENIKQNINDVFGDFYKLVEKNYVENEKGFETLLDTPNMLDENYNSQRIFNYDTPILLPLLQRYNTKHAFNPKEMKMNYPDFSKPLNVLPVDSFKIFYLFTNDDADKKCHLQYKLLSNTLNLIYALKE